MTVNLRERNWVEVQILNYLNDRGHAVPIYNLRDNLIPGKEETVVCTVFDLSREGLVNIFELPGGKMTEITSMGKASLHTGTDAGRRNNPAHRRACWVWEKKGGH